MATIEFTVPGTPKGKGRPRFARIGNGVRTYTPAETANYEARIAYECASQARGQIPLDGPLSVEIGAVFEPPKSLSKRKRAELATGAPHTKKPDCDNIAKAVLDALNGVAYGDDKQVCRQHVEKVYGEDARLDVRISQVEPE